MTRRFASNHLVICYGVLKETITPTAWKHFCCTMLNVNPLEKGTTLTALFPTPHAHSQGSLHYRQPWAVKGTTLTALIHTFHDTINFIQQLDLMVH